MEPAQQRAMQCARLKGASSTLTTLPVAEHGLHFQSKRDFRDHILLRYHWQLPKLAEKCKCGETYSVDHAQICKTSGFIHMRHDEMIDFLALCAKEIRPDVEVEPHLQPLTGEVLKYKSANRSPDARSDLRVGSFWSRCQQAFFDMRVFYPFAKTYVKDPLDKVFEKQEAVKNREYRERIREVEHGAFTPLIFSAAGGMGKQAEIFLKTLAAGMSYKRNEEYSSVIAWLRCSLQYCLARSAIRCIRGSRQIKRRPRNPPIQPSRLVMAECFIN